MSRTALRVTVGTRFFGVIVALAGLTLATGCGKGKTEGGAATAGSATSTSAGGGGKAGGGGGAADPNMQRFTNQGADNQIDVPKDWSAKPVADSLVINSPDKQVFIELSASLAMGKDSADEKKLMARLEKSLQGAKRTSPITKASQNGLSGWKFAGTAEKAGQHYDWESFELEDAAGKGAFGLVYASTKDIASHRAVIDKILGSISAVKH